MCGTTGATWTRVARELEAPTRAGSAGRDRDGYFSETKARPLFAFIGITSWLAPAS